MYYKSMSEKVMVTIELQEYQYLKDFYYKCESKEVFIFDDWHKTIYYTDKDLGIVEDFNKELKWKDKNIDELKDLIHTLRKQTFKQKLKNLFKW